MSLTSNFMGAMAALMLATPALAEIEFHHQYARSSTPVVGAAFVIIHNHGDAGDRLLSVASDAASRVELHTHMEDENGVMRMTHLQEGFDLPAGGEIVMVRGSNHVMLMGLTAPFEQGDMISVTFTFQNAGDITVEIPVDQDRTEADHSDMDHGDNSDHGDHASDG